MLLINCPWCGPRAEDEFIWGGEAERSRPIQPDELNDAEWADYLYNRTNAKGWVRERWYHTRGCGLWFKLDRDNVTHDVNDISSEHRS